MSERKRVFSGIQPTGDIHIGNYLGAVRHWAARQDELDSFFCVVDLHAMTLPWDAASLRHHSISTGAILIAAGIDPARSTLFIQSDVREHSELAWILTCLARMGELRRMIQFKEKSKGDGESVGAGLLTYPALMAADVLLYRAHGVPVGEDQRQHVELMRDLAIRFNSMFGKTFVVPEAWIPEAGARIMALDDPTQKMSKSAPRPASKILVIDRPEAILKKIRSAVTDSGTEVKAAEDKPALTNLLTILSVIEETPIAELEERFSGSGYGDFKKVLGDAVVEWLSPVRERYEELMADPAETERLLLGGADKARATATAVIEEVRRRVGLRS
ncbi:MAG: tryptophanyl-tRNA synthetase [Actinomycetota bacterium]|nr:tryptophanyl-tRNA synthetase [Actinomycetota bacterium]